MPSWRLRLQSYPIHRRSSLANLLHLPMICMLRFFRASLEDFRECMIFLYFDANFLLKLFSGTREFKIEFSQVPPLNTFFIP